MGYINLLELYQLEKKYLEVWLRLIIPTLLSMIVDKKAACSYNQLYVVVNPDF